ncbi:RAI1-domain-containing protein [Epithele typhae]|uniref:RAI1-domain-containing protein n=1 Tax=Epithele typhae TaxID=378194 RepID=UPI0020082CDB|nr:RAI1-domain-containing protein [Epithele typhae]KAH9921552.1 RAI1-domain-containing protein [Epithele typhae]
MSKRRLSSSSATTPPPSKSPPKATSLPYPSTALPHTARPVPFQQPTGLLTFSYNPQRALELTDSALRYYIDPPPNADLKYGYDRWIKRPEEKTRLDGLLRAIDCVMQKTDTNMGAGCGRQWLHDIAVVTWRGVMTKILTAPYEERDKCELNAMLVNGTLYLEEHTTDAKLIDKENLAPRQRQQTYYGYSFESWCTSSSPGVPERIQGQPVGWGGDVDTNVQWCSVVKTKLGDNRLVIGGEVDCVRDRFKGQTDTFVELKTSMSIRGPEDEARFEKKMLRFYMQSFLLGVPEVVVGFRTPAGRLTTTQSFKTVQLPRLVRGKPHGWDPQICLYWGQQFISSLRSQIAATLQVENQADGGGMRRVWRVTLSPREGATVRLLDDVGVQEVVSGDDRVGFMPAWFFDKVNTPV